MVLRARTARTLLGIVLATPVLVALAMTQVGQSTSADESGGEGRAVVERVVDGDTIVVRIEGSSEKIRLIGIDTPESVDPRSPVECFGTEASARTAELLPEGTEVDLVRDVEARDRYDRLLAYVYRASDGLFVNEALARDGYAVLSTYPPNVAHVEALQAAVADARSAGRGLWASCPAPED